MTSVLRFSTQHPVAAAFIEGSLGWAPPNGTNSALLSAQLVYTTDGWRSLGTASLQYLADHSQGFLLRDVAPGTELEFAVQADFGQTKDGHRSYYEKIRDVWLTRPGENFFDTTQDNPTPHRT